MYGLLKGIYVLSDHMLERLKEEQLLNLYVQIELPLAELVWLKEVCTFPVCPSTSFKIPST